MAVDCRELISKIKGNAHDYRPTYCVGGWRHRDEYSIFKTNATKIFITMLKLNIWNNISEYSWICLNKNKLLSYEIIPYTQNKITWQSREIKPNGSFIQSVLRWEYSPWQIRYWQSSHLADIVAGFELKKIEFFSHVGATTC